MLEVYDFRCRQIKLINAKVHNIFLLITSIVTNHFSELE